MSESSVMQEFLIKLGYKVDEAQGKKFDKFLSDSKKAVFSYGQTATEAGTAVYTSVALMAESFEKLYYVSQRTGTSVGALQALQFGAAQIGVSAETATASIQTMVRTMQLNPGTAALMSRLGVDPAQADKAKVFVDLMERLHRMPAYIGSQYASQFGISDSVYNMYTPERIAEEKRKEAMYKELAGKAGVNPDKLAADSREFMNDLRVLGALLGLFGMQVASGVLPIIKDLTHALEYLDNLVLRANKWSKDNLPGGSKMPAVEALGVGVAGAVATKALLKWGLGQLGIGVATGAGVSAGTTAAGWGTKVVGGFLGGTEAAAAPAEAIGLLGGIKILLAGMPSALGAIITSPITLAAVDIGLAAYTVKASTDVLKENERNRQDTLAMGRAALNDFKNRQNLPSIKGHNPGDLRSGSGFASFSDDEVGFEAMARQILIDAKGHGQNTIATLLGGINGKHGWSPIGENNTPMLISEMSKRTGIQPNAPINFDDPNTLAAIMRAIAVQENGGRNASGNLYDQSMVLHAATDAQAKYMPRSVSVSQTNHTTITGVPDAPAVRRASDASHAQSQRDLQGAIR